jgi:ankyrin repeat protein
MTHEDLFEAIDTHDVGRLNTLLSAQPTLAGERDDEDVSAVLHARYRNDQDAVARLMAASPELDVFDASGLGQIGRLEELLVTDPSLATAVAGDGFTPLHLAAFFGNTGAARHLLDHGAEPNAISRNQLRLMALHSAAAGGHVGIARLLVAAGADVNATHQHDYTPLHATAHNGDAELTDLLLAAGADPTARTDKGQTPADLAAAAGHDALARRLAQHSAK